MKIGIIGAGPVGVTLARQLSAVGHTIKLANSRGPETLATIVAELSITAVSATDAVRDVDIVIIAVPEQSIALLPKDLFDNVSKDVVVIETGNYVPKGGLIDAIEHGMPESCWVAQELRRPVVKAFNSITAWSLADKGRPSGTTERIALPVSGDDTQAKAIVIGLADAIGFDGIDAGNLEESWRQQPGTPVYCTDYGVEGVLQGLSQADRARSPRLRDLLLEGLTQLPEGFTLKDLINFARSVSTLEIDETGE